MQNTKIAATVFAFMAAAIGYGWLLAKFTDWLGLPVWAGLVVGVVIPILTLALIADFIIAREARAERRGIGTS